MSARGQLHCPDYRSMHACEGMTQGWGKKLSKALKGKILRVHTEPGVVLFQPTRMKNRILGALSTQRGFAFAMGKMILKLNVILTLPKCFKSKT